MTSTAKPAASYAEIYDANQGLKRFPQKKQSAWLCLMENLETKMTKLAALYFLICEFKNNCSPIYFQRNCPNSFPAISDEETLAIYLFGLLEGRRGVKSCYKLVKLYWTDWFPDLGSYQAFNRRINDIWPMLSLLIHFLNNEKLKTATEVLLVDSLPSCLPAFEKGGHGTPPASKSISLR